MNSFMIDTNVILDVLFMRQDFFDDSNKIIDMCENNRAKGYITTSVLMDIRYFVYKYTHNKDLSNKTVKELIKILNVLEVSVDDIEKASSTEAKDFEDTVIENCSVRNKLDFIVTRNEKHFDGSKIKILSPTSYLNSQI